jgi:hypothetical protein
VADQRAPPEGRPRVELPPEAVSQRTHEQRRIGRTPGDHQPRVLGTKTVTLNGGQKAKVTVKLNKLGKRILKGKHKLKIVFTAQQKLPNGKTKTVTRKTLTLRSK